MSLIKEADFGTPIPETSIEVSLEIDGARVSVPQGTSIMAAAMMMGTKIPKLCATDMLDAFGSCRLCLVEIEGRRGTPASCTTPVEEGMVVHTQTSRLAKLRKGVMELYISDHPLDCLTCSANGDCELQDMAGAVGLRDVAMVMKGRAISMPARTRAIPISALNHQNVSSAHVACVPAKRFRGHLPSPLQGGVLTRMLQPAVSTFYRRNACHAGLAFKLVRQHH